VNRRHGRACPGHPDQKGVALYRSEITGTRPVMTCAEHRT
jgi:hypothetical protein